MAPFIFASTVHAATAIHGGLRVRVQVGGRYDLSRGRGTLVRPKLDPILLRETQ